MGGMIAAIESGYANQLIADSAWEQQLAFEHGERTIVGRQRLRRRRPLDRRHRALPERPGRGGAPDRSGWRTSSARARSAGSRDALRALEAVAGDLHHNRMPLIEEAVRARATVGEICDVLRSVWGEYRPSTVF